MKRGCIGCKNLGFIVWPFLFYVLRGYEEKDIIYSKKKKSPNG